MRRHLLRTSKVCEVVPEPPDRRESDRVFGSVVRMDIARLYSVDVRLVKSLVILWILGLFGCHFLIFEFFLISSLKAISDGKGD